MSTATTATTMTSDATRLRVETLRAKQRAGEKLSLEEMREAIALIRGDRVRAATASAKSKTAKAAKAPIDSEALLGELDGL